MNQYEGMFLFDPTFASSFEKCEAEVRRLMDRAGGELLFCRKWDERRLAFRINGRKRGVYVLTYFNVAPDKIPSLERDVTLSEDVLRLMVLRADDVTPEYMEEQVPQRGDGAGGGEPSGSPDAGKVVKKEVEKKAVDKRDQPAAESASTSTETTSTETAVADPEGDDSAPKSE